MKVTLTWEQREWMLDLITDILRWRVWSRYLPWRVRCWRWEKYEDFAEWTLRMVQGEEYRPLRPIYPSHSEEED